MDAVSKTSKVISRLERTSLVYLGDLPSVYSKMDTLGNSKDEDTDIRITYGLFRLDVGGGP